MDPFVPSKTRMGTSDKITSSVCKVSIRTSGAIKWYSTDGGPQGGGSVVPKLTRLRNAQLREAPRSARRHLRSGDGLPSSVPQDLDKIPSLLSRTAGGCKGSHSLEPGAIIKGHSAGISVGASWPASLAKTTAECGDSPATLRPSATSETSSLHPPNSARLPLSQCKSMNYGSAIRMRITARVSRKRYRFGN